MPHTPGPWTSVDSEIIADDGTHVVCFGHDYDEYGGIHARECLIPTGPFTGEPEQMALYYEERDANARLIAASPRLLNALRGMVGLIQLVQRDRPDLLSNHRYVEALATIEEVEGNDASSS